MKTTVYISGQISGIPHSEALINFCYAEELLKCAGLKTINPLTYVHDVNGTWKDFMIQDIRLLFKCNAIYMLAGWQKSKGARIEHAIAVELNMPIYYHLVGSSSPFFNPSNVALPSLDLSTD